MWKKYFADVLNIGLIFIISIFFVWDLFFHVGQPATFDGPTHISNIAQIYHGLTQGDLPVTWGDGFARYGMPIPLIAQQVPSYLGAFFTFFTHNVIVSYNIVVFVGAFLSTVFLYLFLRLYADPLTALAGAFLFHFAPYRIENVYIRGAQPEFFASTFIALILISLYLSIEKNKLSGYLLLCLSVALLLLTHPFTFVIGGLLFGPYAVFLLWKKKNWVMKVVMLGLSTGLGLGLAAYYLVPLFLEIKYFYYGLSPNHFVYNHFLDFSSYVTERWFYFRNDDIFPRGYVHQSGILETGVILIGLGYSLWLYLKKKTITLLHIFLLSTVAVIFLTFSPSLVLYEKIKLLSNIQHPWRMLTAFIFVAPIIVTLLLSKIKNIWVPLVLIIIVSFWRFPQIYGKNYTNFPQDTYFHTEDNLHGVIMNTIWTGQTREYPFQPEKAKIIEGKGKITAKEVKNSSRKYQINAETAIRLVDYTFYFPGWKVYVDGQPTEIQFQDPNYRGVITYNVPSGSHEVKLKFEDTKPRTLGKILSLLSVVTFVILLFMLKRLKFLNKLLGRDGH